MKELLLKSLTDFYTKEDNYQKLLSILNHPKVSLRLIDWFVTNYSKKYNIIYLLKYNQEENNYSITEDNKESVLKQINVYQGYKAQLKAFSKKRFDPFCRRERVDYECNNQMISTTVGQLNFFRWAIKNYVIEYIEGHADRIENDMNESLLETKKISKKDKGRKSRQELSKSASRGLNKNKLSVCLSFD
jgi:hypothetical protein